MLLYMMAFELHIIIIIILECVKFKDKIHVKSVRFRFHFIGVQLVRKQTYPLQKKYR